MQKAKASVKEAVSETKSIGAVIGESLAKDTQARVDEVMDKVNGYYKTAKEYVSENPKEAVALIAAVGIGVWALLYTKPGRRIFERGAGFVVPQVSDWVTQTFAISKDSLTKH